MRSAGCCGSAWMTASSPARPPRRRCRRAVACCSRPSRWRRARQSPRSSPSMPARSFRFRPRFRALAWSSVGVGGALAPATLGGALVPLVTGALGVVLGSGYLLSPSWKLEVLVDDDALEVRGAKGTKIRLAWSEVVEVVASNAPSTCFVDGGEPAKSLLVPGVGAPAPNDIEDKPGLLAEILAHVDPAKVQEVASLH